MSILAIHPGTYYHIESLEAPRYAQYFDKLVRPEDLPSINLSDYNVVFIPCRTPADRMFPVAAQLREYLDNGGTIVATGESDQAQFLPNIKFTAQPTNFWWWLTPGADLGVRVVKPAHSLFEYLTEKDCTYHLHGSYDVPEGAEVLVVNERQLPILYIDQVTTKGRMVITSLDPIYHHGSHFMPATTRFLDGFLPWVREQLDQGAK